MKTITQLYESKLNEAKGDPQMVSDLVNNYLPTFQKLIKRGDLKHMHPVYKTIIAHIEKLAGLVETNPSDRHITSAGGFYSMVQKLDKEFDVVHLLSEITRGKFADVNKTTISATVEKQTYATITIKGLKMKAYYPNWAQNGHKDLYQILNGFGAKKLYSPDNIEITSFKTIDDKFTVIDLEIDFKAY